MAEQSCLGRTRDMAASATAPWHRVTAVIKVIVVVFLMLGLVLLLILGTVSWFKSRAENRLDERYEECLRTVSPGADPEMECGSADSWLG